MELRPITNRDFKLPDDGWIQVAPLGEYPHPSGIIQVLDKEACEAMVNRFNEESKAENFPGLLLDFDHFSNDSKAPSTAAGWIEELQNREDGLWAKVRWSGDGSDAIQKGNYRLVSPVWNRSQCEDLGDNRFRPQRLDRAALTNDPVLKGMCPVSNRNGSADNEGLVTREEMAKAISDAVKEALENRGTSSGAHKGWETRRGALSAHHTAQAAKLKSFAAAAEKRGDKGTATSVRATAAKHEELAASYATKKSASSAKASLAKTREEHMNAELGKLKSAPKQAARAPKGDAKPGLKKRLHEGNLKLGVTSATQEKDHARRMKG